MTPDAKLELAQLTAQANQTARISTDGTLKLVLRMLLFICKCVAK